MCGAPYEKMFGAGECALQALVTFQEKPCAITSKVDDYNYQNLDIKQEL